MASFRIIACLGFFVVLASVVAAHDGHDHSHMAPGPMPGMDMRPPSSPGANAAVLTSSPSVVGFLAVVVSFLAVIGNRG
ncbi:hypothetical protein ACS0TY_008989 [Phlomoides rotata]